MNSRYKLLLDRTWRQVEQIGRSRGVRLSVLIVLIFFLLYGLFGFFIAPSLIQRIAEQQLRVMLKRPTHIEHVAFNPYTLKLQAKQIHIGEQEGGDFIDINRLILRISWLSFVHVAPVIDQLTIDSPRVQIVRYHAKQFNFTDLINKFSSPSASSSPSKPALFVISNIELNNGRVDFDDRMLGVKHVIDQLSLKIPFITTLRAKTQVDIEPHFSARVDGSLISVNGATKLMGETRESTILLKVNDLDLPSMLAYAPFSSPVIVSRGKLAGDITLHFLMTKNELAWHVNGAADLSRAQITDKKHAPLIEIDSLHVAVSELNPLKKMIHVDEIVLNHPMVYLARDQSGALNISRLLASSPASSTAASSDTNNIKDINNINDASEKTETSAAWRYKVDALNVKNASVEWLDEHVSPPVKFNFSPIQFSVAHMSDESRAPLQLRGSVAFNGKGSLDLSGDMTMRPLSALLTINSNRFDVAPFTRYLEGTLNATVTNACLNAQGELRLNAEHETISASYRGDVALVDVRVREPLMSTSLVSWRTLALTQLHARYNAQGIDIDVGRMTFAHFFARVLLDAQGQLNLAHLLARKKPATHEQAPPPHASSTASTEIAGSKAAPFTVRIGETVLQQGRVNYTDNFIKPHFTTKLTDIEGKIGILRTPNKNAEQASEPASVHLSATLEDNGPVAIDGVIDPFASKPSLDIKASAHEIELTNLTSYSSKYVGYPITKGKLNVELHYTLNHDVLSANNHLFIDQLTFGKHIDNETETKLPVQLAVALLKNSRGQIDVNIPVSGSLSNPDFSLGHLIWSAVLHLIQKALTAPFTLLASTVSHAGELGYVEFAPGSAVLAPDAQSKLDTVIKMLNDKPEVKIDLIGRVDPTVDLSALKAAYVDKQVRRQKIQAVESGDETVDVSTVTVAPSEYDMYLKQVYQAADFEKPRNFIGLTKNVPVQSMKEALAEHAPIGEPDLRALAQARAHSVRRYLQGKVAASRVFTVAPKLDAQGVQGQGVTTRVDLGLTN